jgi:DNA-binding HxlR family transcriptional regulator
MATKRTYREACRFAHALDLVGERWALLIVRELLLGPKRFTDLRAGLPHASTNILSERLRELEQNAVVRRRKLPPPYASTVYELTEWGRELEPIVTQLGAWGARSPIPPDAQEIGVDSIVLALGSLFDPERAGELSASYDVQIGEARFSVEVDSGEVGLHRGSVEDPEGVFVLADAAAMGALLSGQLDPEQALASGVLEIERGGKQSLKRFLRLFPMPEPCACERTEGVVAAATA